MRRSHLATGKTARKQPSRNANGNAESESEGMASLWEVSEDEDEFPSGQSNPLKEKGKARAVETDISTVIFQNAFDAYFAHTSKPSHTSSDVFSAILSPLTAQEYSALIEASRVASKHRKEIGDLTVQHEGQFPRYLIELLNGFNLLFYGLGSKRKILNKFAVEHCAKRGHVVISNAFNPHFGLKDLLTSIENTPGLTASPLTSGGIESQIRRIYDFFAPEPLLSDRPLFLVIHNIDAPSLRTAKAKACLSLLALNPRIYVVASVDRISSPLLWTSTENSTRKHIINDSPRGLSGTRGFAWLWHDLSTLEPYDFELSFADRSSISGVSTMSGASSVTQHGGVAPVNGISMTETAAQHILASVTLRAKKLFVILGRRQLEANEEGTTTSSDMSKHAVGYDMLFLAARHDFVATNDTAMAALLGEFRDHGLILSQARGLGGGEALWIPLRKDLLVKILDSLKVELRIE